jgi:hypothetical protein
MITLGSYKKFPRGYKARQRPRVFGTHPLDSWVSEEFLAQRLMHQELAADHLNAIRLLKELVAAGATRRAPIASDWVDEIALRNLSLQVTDLASAIACAERERWLADIPTRKGCISLTRAGEVIARVK